jgi:predicted  nucleic acid-binding Zn-ribbon protein
MTENSLKNKIKQLKSELELKNKEISNYCDRIEYLEDSIMEIEESLSKKSSKSTDALLKFQMKELEIKYRELKDNMGFVRKENAKLKTEIDKIKKTTNNSSSIKIVTRNSLSNEVITSIAKDLVFIENEIKKTDMNKEEIGNRLRNLMKIIRNR